MENTPTKSSQVLSPFTFVSRFILLYLKKKNAFDENQLTHQKVDTLLRILNNLEMKLARKAEKIASQYFHNRGWLMSKMEAKTCISENTPPGLRKFINQFPLFQYSSLYVCQTNRF